MSFPARESEISYSSFGSARHLSYASCRILLRRTGQEGPTNNKGCKTR